jgi:E3 ubiquitin-protein ligase MARCH6
MRKQLPEEDVDEAENESEPAGKMEEAGPRPAQKQGEQKEVGKDEVYLEPEGRYVRAPAVDQIRIPKGVPVFIDVDDENRLVNEGSVHELYQDESKMVTKVYIPPWFKLRIAFFVLAVWLFAAATGLSVTILPLLLGRYLLSFGRSSGARINDIYAFSFGIYTLGIMVYLGGNATGIARYAKGKVSKKAEGLGMEMLWHVLAILKRGLSVIYVYSTLIVAVPCIAAAIMELYFLMPLHSAIGTSDTHVVHLVQDWTLGILYVRILAHVFLSPPEVLPPGAIAVNGGPPPTKINRILMAIIRPDPRGGYLNPNARLATRALVLPCLLVFSVVVFAPFAAGWLLNNILFKDVNSKYSANLIQAMLSTPVADSNATAAASTLADTDPAAALSLAQRRLLRLAYPVAAVACFAMYIIWSIMRATRRWRLRIRDEVYLIGERLHNFGDSKKASKRNKGKGLDVKGKGKWIEANDAGEGPAVIA